MLRKIIPYFLYAQCFGLQYLSYLVLIPSLIFNRLNKKFLLVIFLLILMMLSLIIRDADFLYAIRAIQYYGGLLIAYSAFYVNKKIKIDQFIFIIYAGFVIVEFLLKINGYQIFYLDQISLNNESLDLRTAINDSFFRCLGPALNSSVSSVILAIGIIKSHEIRKHYLYLVFCLVAFLLCWSASGFLVFLIFFIYKIKNNLYRLILVIGIISTIFLDIPKINIDYFIYILDYKIQYLNCSNCTLLDIILGKNLKNEFIENIGGDAIYLNFIKIYGLFLVGIYTFLIINWTSSGNKIYIISGIVVSFHYGAIFNLMGQFVFGALMADKIQIYGNSIPKRVG